MNDQQQTPETLDAPKDPAVSSSENIPPAAQLTNGQPQAPNTTPNKPKKMRTILLVVIGGLLVLGVAVAIIYFLFFYVSKADYKNAEKQTNTTLTTYHKADDAAQEWATAVTDPSSTDRDIASKKTAYNNANSAYKASVNDMSDMRALKDGKVKSAYDAFIAKNNVAMDNNTTLAEAMPTIRTMVVECNGADTSGMDTNDLSTIASAWDKAFAGCTKAIKDLASVKNADVATVGKKLEGYFQEMRTDIVALQNAYVAKDESAFMKAYNSFTDVENKYNSDESLKNIKKHQDSLTPEAEINKLLAAIRSRE